MHFVEGMMPDPGASEGKITSFALDVPGHDNGQNIKGKAVDSVVSALYSCLYSTALTHSVLIPCFRARM